MLFWATILALSLCHYLPACILHAYMYDCILYMWDISTLSSVQGVMVKTDYIPLLQSLAPYGWRLMCVLPTPIVKTNRYPRKNTQLSYHAPRSRVSTCSESYHLNSARTTLCRLILSPKMLPASLFLGLGLTAWLRYAGQMVQDLTNLDHMLITTWNCFWNQPGLASSNAVIELLLSCNLSLLQTAACRNWISVNTVACTLLALQRSGLTVVKVQLSVFVQWREFVDEANSFSSETRFAAQEKRLQGLSPFLLLQSSQQTCHSSSVVPLGHVTLCHRRCH